MVFADYSTRTVLAVDDDVQNLKVIRHLLKRSGVKLETAESGIEAVKVCARKKFDLILLDHMMPDPDGIETLHLLREDMLGQNRDTKVIALTANAEEEREMYLAEGFDGYLLKPVKIERLEDIFSRYMEPSHCAGAVCYTGAVLDAETVKSTEETGDTRAALKVEQQGAEELMRCLEQNGIRALDGLKYSDGDIMFYRNLCAVFVKDFPVKRQKLDHIVNNLAADSGKQWNALVSVSHGLKGEARGIGADKLGELFYKLELSGRGREKNKTEELYPTVIGEWLRVTDIISTVI